MLTSFIIPTAHYIFDHILPVQRIFMSHDPERREAPVYSIQAQMSRVMICQIVGLSWMGGFQRRKIKGTL